MGKGNRNGDNNGEGGPAGAARGSERQTGEVGVSKGTGKTEQYRECYEWEGADYIRHLQHSKWTQGRSGGGTQGDVPG